MGFECSPPCPTHLFPVPALRTQLHRPSRVGEESGRLRNRFEIKTKNNVIKQKTDGMDTRQREPIRAYSSSLICREACASAGNAR